MPTIPIADKPTLDQVLAYVDTLETLLGTANPASGDLTTVFKGLKLIADYVDTLESNLGTTGDAANAAGTVLARLAELLTNRLTAARAGYLDGDRYYMGSYYATGGAWVNALNISGRGELNHLMMSMGNTNGNYQIKVDGTVIMSGSLNANYWYLPTIQGGGLLQMNSISGNIWVPPLNIRFKSSLLIEVYPNGSSLNTVFGYNLI